MKKIKGSVLVLIIIGAVFALWNVLALSLANLHEARHFYWFGYGFTVFSFLAVAAIVWLIGRDKFSDIGVRMPVYIVTGAYWGVSFIMNMIFMIFSKKTNVPAVLIPNIVVIVLAAVVFVLALAGVKHVSGNKAETDKKVLTIKMNMIKVDQIIAICEDEEVLRALKELKSAIEYSDPMSVPATESIEAEFVAKLGEIKSAVEDGIESAFVLKKIKSASAKLGERNAMLRALK